MSMSMILLAFVTSSDGLSVELERTDITGRHYRFTPFLYTQNATERWRIFCHLLDLYTGLYNSPHFNSICSSDVSYPKAGIVADQESDTRQTK
jgi:hypothetical protein